MFFARRVPSSARDAYSKDAASGMLGAVMLGLTVPFFGVIARKTLHASGFEIGVISMAPVAGYLFSLLWAKHMEGRRRMPFAVWAWVASRSTLFAAVFATTATSFIIMAAAFYLILSIASPAYSAIIREIYPAGERATLMGYARVCTISVYVLVLLFTVVFPILEGHNYRFVFPIAGLFGVASALVFSRILTTDTTGETGTPLHQFVRESIMILRDDGGYRWFCTGIFIFGFANFLAQPAFTIYQVDIGVDTRWAGAFSIVASAMMPFAYYYWGRIIDRRRPEKIVAIQALAWIAIPIIYTFADRPWMLLFTALISGVIGAGVELVYFTGVLHYSSDELFSRYYALFLSLMGIRGILGPMIGGAMVDLGIVPIKAIFLASAGVMLVSVWVQLEGARRFPKPREIGSTHDSGERTDP